MPAGLRSWLPLGPAALLVLLALAAPIASGDLWWHVRLGQWMLDARALPASEPFSHTLAGADVGHWAPQEYGSELCFGVLERWAGVAALKVAGVLLAGFALALAARRARDLLPPLWAGAAVALFAALYALKWELRPHLVSLPFFLTAERWWFGPRPPRRPIAAAFALACVWVQLHAEALLAPLAALAAAAGASAAAAAGDPAARARLGPRWSCTAAALAGSLASPLLAEPYRYALVGRAVPQQFIEEWSRPWILPGDPRFAPLTLPLLVLAGLCFAVGVAHVAARARRSADWERTAFLLLCLVLAASARRYFWLLWFPALDVLGALAARREAAIGAVRGTALALGLAGGSAAVLWGTHFPQRAIDALSHERFARDADDVLFPVHAAAFAAEAGLQGNLFHRYEHGGFLLWALGPACPVFVYGETVLFGEVLEERWKAEHDPAAAAQVFARRDICVAIMPRLVRIDGEAEFWRPPGGDPPNGEQGGWVRAWADGGFIVWLRADDEANLGRAAAHLARLGIAFDTRRGFVEAAALAAHPEWLRAKRLVPEPAASELEPLYQPNSLADPASAARRAEIYERHRLNRCADWERERAGR